MVLIKIHRDSKSGIIHGKKLLTGMGWITGKEGYYAKNNPVFMV
jgi:hypothetical protein